MSTDRHAAPDQTMLPPSIEPTRAHRNEMRAAMTAVELAIAAPVPGRASAWADAVGAALDRLAADFQAHVASTEAPGGLHAEIVAQVPRLSGPVGRLTDEHVTIGASLADLRAGVGLAVTEDVATAVREQTLELLARLARHRQRGADLVWEAFTVDIGGET